MLKITWLSKILAKVASYFGNASNEIHDVAVISTNVVNAIKNAEQSNIGQLVETGLEMVIPASSGLINAFKLWLPVVLKDLNWVVGETNLNLTLPDLQNYLSAAASYLSTIKGTDVYAAQLNSLNALVQKWFSDQRGLGLTMPQALLTPQAVYNPNLVQDIPHVVLPNPYKPVINEVASTNDQQASEPQMNAQAMMQPQTENTVEDQVSTVSAPQDN